MKLVDARSKNATEVYSMSLFVIWFRRIVGVLFSTLYLCLLAQRLRFLTSSTVTEGEVIDQKPHYQKPVPITGRAAKAVGIFAFFADLFSRLRPQQEQGVLHHARPGPLMNFPVVRYTFGDRTVEFTHPVGSDSISFPTGTKVPVRYQPEWPEVAMISSFGSIWMPVIILAILSGMFLAVGFFGLGKQ